MKSKYIKNIYGQIDKMTGERRLSVTVAEVCREAKTSCATFYAHFRSCEEARNLHEDELEAELINMLPKKVREREALFTILLSFLYRNRRYFRANFRSGDAYLLRRIMLRLKYTLGCASISERTYLIYIGVVIAIVSYWIERKEPIEITLPECAKQLARIPFYRF